MSRSDDRRDRRPPPGGAERSELQDAADRLEAAVQDFARTASGAVSSRATRMAGELERTARRLQSQLDLNADDLGLGDDGMGMDDDGTGLDVDDDGTGHGADGQSRRARRRARRRVRRERWSASGEGETRATKRNGWLRDLYREPERGWIAGVCAGIARYYDVEPWVARLVGFSMFLFVPAVFWAYIAGIFLLARRPKEDAMRRTPRPSQDPRATDSPAPELGPRLAPRRGVRSVSVRMRDLELRLRRMESYVTSREFTLTRELSALETRGAADPGEARNG